MTILLDSQICAYAQEWADNLAHKDAGLQHRTTYVYSENLFWSMGQASTGVECVDAWYAEIKDYQQYFGTEPPRSALHSTGHFTCMVWKESTELGIARATSKQGGTFVVANFSPPGNIYTHFKNNVLPPI